MPSDRLPPPPPPSILDRFKALLKQQKAGRVPGDDDDDDELGIGSSSAAGADVVQLYELMLSELTFNCKPIITDLTIVAGEHRVHGEGIADAICARIVEAPVEQKLPSLYLLDSIAKNIGREYVRYFSSRLPEVFCEAYRQVHPHLHPSMRHLFGTWVDVFPPSVLRKIETQLRFSPSVKNQSSSSTLVKTSESARPTHGIHVNPKYLRQLEDSTSEKVGAQRRTSAESSTPPSFALGANKLHQSSTFRIAKPLSPAAERPLSPELDGFGSSNSPQRLVHGASPSHPVLHHGFGHGLGRTGDGEEEPEKWRRKHYSDDRESRFETSAVRSIGNRHERQGLRALIDAYGDERGKRITNNKHFQLEHLNVNGRSNKLETGSWQNTEEEEFVWEAMSPTLSSQDMSNNLLPSSSLSRLDFLGNITNQVQPGGKIDSYSTAEDLHAAISYNKKPGPHLQINQNVRSWDPREQLNLPRSTHLPFARENLALHGNKSNSETRFVHPPILSSRKRSAVEANTSETWPHHSSSSNPSLQPTFPSQRQTMNHFQFPTREKALETFPQTSIISMPPQIAGYPMQRHGGASNLPPQNSLPLPVNNVLNNLQSHPPMPPGQVMLNLQNSGLFNSLMSQGLISLTKQSPLQESLGLEFNADLLKARHESAITALYSDLPRQCMSCGLRFKCQEVHRSHMDWHVTRNRTSKSRKQKPSRKWFVSASMWLTGAEALGTDAVPGFLALENDADKKDNDLEEMAVPADEDQTACELCGEPFEDFFSDETEEWMYKGAVYLYAPYGSTSGIDRSQLGPIVHAKCKPESSAVHT